MANTLQKKIKFSKGQVVPELIERTDLESYDSSAQVMDNVVSTIYGGVRSRRGTKKVDRILTGIAREEAIATTGIGGNASYLQDPDNDFVSDPILGNRNIFTLDYEETKTGGTISIRGIKLAYKAPVIQEVLTKTSYITRGTGGAAFTEHKITYVSSVSIVDGGFGVRAGDTLIPNPSTGWKNRTPNFPFTINNYGTITAVENPNDVALGVLPMGPYLEGDKRGTKTLTFSRAFGERILNASLYYSSDGSSWTRLQTKSISETEQDFDFTIPESFRYIKFDIDQTNESIQTTLSLKYVSGGFGAYVSSDAKLVDFVYNDTEKYLICLTNNLINIYKDDSLIVTKEGIPAGFFKLLKWTYKDDSVVFTHPDMPPKLLKRLSDGTWTFGNLDIKNTPVAAFNGETTTHKTIGITPSDVEGAIKITADSSVFTSDWVGQYIDGGGGKVKITEYVSGTVVNGYTIIPFYTKDKISSWDYISGYEPVWSLSRGYPRTCVFAQQRLWFGGSKQKPSTVWASRVGDYFDFRNSGNYDNDSIDVDLLTNDVIVNLVDNRGLHVFTTGQEVTSPEGTYTPDKISFTTNTRNGSVPSVRPVVLSGNVCYIEKNGKSLLNYVYDDSQAAYISDNISMLSSLLNKPVAMSAEINSSKDKGDFLYIVLEDGTMVVGCIVLSQNIKSLSMFKTDGKIKDVCCLREDAYIIVDRGSYSYIEKIGDVRTDATTSVSYTDIPRSQLYCWFNTEGQVFTKSEEVSSGDIVYDNFADEIGEITSVEGSKIVVDEKEYEREEELDKTSDIYIPVLSDYNNKKVYLYDDEKVYEIDIVNNGKLKLRQPIYKTLYVGLPFEYDLLSNPIAINHKTTSIKKRIATAELVCQDTPRMNFCGQQKYDQDTYKFYSCTSYGNDVRFNIKGEFYPMQILSVQLNINYEG